MAVAASDDFPVQRRPDSPRDAGGDRTASRSITFETYIYWSGKIGQKFAEALAERAAQNLEPTNPAVYANRGTLLSRVR